jgi:hypothetical protein
MDSTELTAVKPSSRRSDVIIKKRKREDDDAQFSLPIISSPPLPSQTASIVAEAVPA